MTEPVRIISEPLMAASFAPFGEVLETAMPPDRLINGGLCERFHDRALLDFDESHGGRAGISLFRSQLCGLPYRLELVERHPLGSQAFIPMSESRFLVIVASDNGGRPEAVRAFVARSGQGVNLRRNVWHGVLCPLDGSGIYAVVDRIGGGDNLEEFRLETPLLVV